MSCDLTRSLSACSFVAIDFETTGLSAARDRIVEIGAVRFSPGQSERSRYARLVNPQTSIPELVIEVHGITDAAVASAPPFAELVGEFTGFLEGAILVAHHAAFDIAFYTCELRRADIMPAPVLVLDTYHLARKVFPQAPSYKLSALLAWLGLEMEGQAHRALPDSLACALLFEACLKALPLGAESSLADLIRLYPQCRVGLSELEPHAHPAHLSLQQAISSQLDVTIEYRNARNEVLERRISPILLGGYGRFSYVEAYCHLRRENRQFRINRIQKVEEQLTVNS